MLTIDSLKEYGADVETGLARCLNNEQFYLMLVQRATVEDGFDVLKNALESGDFNTAFEVAHSLKGVIGNLALTPIYEPVCALTDLLRDRSACDYADLLDQILEAKARLVGIIG